MIKLVAAVVLFMMVQLSHAKDVSVQQAGYNNALQKMAGVDAEYKADAQAVADSEKAIEKRKKLLAEQQKKAELSKKKYLGAKEKLEQAQVILDKAWKE